MTHTLPENLKPFSDDWAEICTSLGGIMLAALFIVGALARPAHAESITLDCSSYGTYKLEKSWLSKWSTLLYIPPDSAGNWEEGCGGARSSYKVDDNVATCTRTNEIFYRQDTARIAGIIGGEWTVNGRDGGELCETLSSVPTGEVSIDGSKYFTLQIKDRDPKCQYTGGRQVPVIQQKINSEPWVDIRLRPLSRKSIRDTSLLLSEAKYEDILGKGIPHKTLTNVNFIINFELQLIEIVRGESSFVQDCSLVNVR